MIEPTTPRQEPTAHRLGVAPRERSYTRGAVRTASSVVFGALILLVIIGAISGPNTNDATYLAKMHNSPNGTHGNTDAELVTMAHNVCRAFNKGDTVKQIVYSFWGMTDIQRGYLMGAAVSVYCPQNWNTMAGEFNAYSGY